MAAGSTSPEQPGLEDAGAAGPPLPLSLVRRIMCLDEDVSRVSSDGVKAVAWGVQHFLELLAGGHIFEWVMAS